MIASSYAMESNTTAPVTIAMLSVTNQQRGREVRVVFSDKARFAPLLQEGEQFDLFLCFVPDARAGEVTDLIKTTTFWERFASWKGVSGAPNGYPELRQIMDMGGNFDNPNKRAKDPGALMILLGHLDLSNLLLAETLQKNRAITIPFEPWVFGPDTKLVGSGRIAAVLCKSKDHYLKQLTFLSNVLEADLAVQEHVK